MKKIMQLSTLLVFLFALSGCNLFKAVDKESDSDSEVFYYNAQIVINSGDTAKLAELETLIITKIADNPDSNEAKTLNLMLSDVRLALAGVDLLNTASKLFDMVNAADNLEDKATNITSIISMTPEEVKKLELALEGYATLDKNPDIANLSAEQRNTYMTAGIANAMYSANIILSVFDINGDGKVDAKDSTALFPASAPAPSLSTKKFTKGYSGTVPTYAEFIAFWKVQKPKILASLENSVIFLNIALNKSAVTVSVDNAKLTKIIEDIKKEINLYDDISETQFNYIINKVLTGKN